MSAAELIAHLSRRGIRFEVVGERLRFYPQSLLTPDLMESLKQYKADILALMSDREKRLDREELRGWLVIVNEAGAKIGIFNGKAEITWPVGWDLPWRLQVWEDNRENILNLLREAG